MLELRKRKARIQPHLKANVSNETGNECQVNRALYARSYSVAEKQKRYSVYLAQIQRVYRISRAL